MTWLREIGVSRLANTPDVLSTEEIILRTHGWSAPEEQVINEPVIQGKPLFAIDYSVLSFIRTPLFEAYKLLLRDTQDPFFDQVGHKSFTTGDTLSAVCFLARFMGTSQDPSIVAAHNNLIRAMTFTSEHQV
eukprot:6816243-Heterocapsa_arctica.AAC.1